MNVKKESRRYTDDYKVEAIKLARKLKNNKKAAAELNIPESTLNTWIKKAELGDIYTGMGTQTPATAMTQAAEIQKLKQQKENYMFQQLKIVLTMLYWGFQWQTI